MGLKRTDEFRKDAVRMGKGEERPSPGLGNKAELNPRSRFEFSIVKNIFTNIACF